MDKTTRNTLIVLTAMLLTLLDLVLTASADSTISLETTFQHPPVSARPWVFWYWMDGRVTREGITKDLEAMARNGIGGVVLGDICGKEDKDSVKFFSPEWQELFAPRIT